MWTITQENDKIYVTDGTLRVNYGTATKSNLASAKYETTRRNNGGDPNTIQYDTRAILKICNWAARRVKSYIHHKTNKAEDYEEILSIAMLAFANCIKYYNPYHNTAFTSYYYKSIKRIMHDHYMRKVTRGPELRVLKPLNTNTNITHIKCAKSQYHSIAKEDPIIAEYDKVPTHYLTKTENEIIKGRLEGKTLEEIAETIGLSRQRIHQKLKRALKRLKMYYDARGIIPDYQA